MIARLRIPLVVLLVAATTVVGCQTLREVAQLRDVEFALSSVDQAEMAGIQLDRIRGYEDLSTRDALRLTAALSRGELPTQFTLNVAALNPEANGVAAQLVQFDWTLFIEDTETLSGAYNREVRIEPGQVQTLPLTIQMDLLDFFDRGGRDLINLVLSFAGAGEPTNIRLQATPTIRTPIGPIRYPEPITVVHRDIGAIASP